MKQITSCRAVSSDSRPMKQVICSRKSNSKAMPAYKANALTAGIPEREPVEVVEERYKERQDNNNLVNTEQLLCRLIKEY